MVRGTTQRYIEAARRICGIEIDRGHCRMTFAVEVVVVLKPVVNDPQGLVVRDGLHRLGFPGVRSVRVGKYLELEVEGDDEASVRAHRSRRCASSCCATR